MITTLDVVYDGTVLKPSKNVDLIPGKKYTIIITSKTAPESDDEMDPAFYIASLAVDTHIPDLSEEHDHYLYNTPKLGMNG